jgi:molecular chaperone GrpE
MEENVNKEQNNEQEVNNVPEIDWHEKYLYLAADMQNVKKRYSKQISDLTTYANENICKDLLSVIDTLELELKHNYNERFESLYNSILTILNKYGVTQIYPDNERPMLFHGDTDNAVTALPTTDSIADNTIVDVIKKGYKYKDKILRYEDVIVYKFEE